MAGSMSAIAQLTALTKLHLTFSENTRALSLRPLGQLSLLEDLSISCNLEPEACAADMLQSSQDKLHHVRLAARSWSRHTYEALQAAPNLTMLTIKLTHLTAPKARPIAGISAADCFRLDLRNIRSVPDQALLMLSRCAPAVKVHRLSLWDVDDISSQRLASLPSVRELRIISSPQLTGAAFSTHLSVTRLVFVNSPNIGVLGAQHILSTAFPSLQSIAFHCYGSQGFGNRAFASIDALQSLVSGRNLRSVDVRGFRDLTERNIKLLESAFSKAQREDNAQPLVTLHLPLRSTRSFVFGHCQSLGTLCNGLHAPPFWRQSFTRWFLIWDPCRQILQDDLPWRNQRRKVVRKHRHRKMFLFLRGVQDLLTAKIDQSSEDCESTPIGQVFKFQIKLYVLVHCVRTLSRLLA